MRRATYSCNVRIDSIVKVFHLITWKAVDLTDLEDQTYFNETEKKAEKFASVLLLPGNEVQAEVAERLATQKQFTYSDLVDIAMEFGVSVKALLYRMANLRMLAWEEADRIAKDQELSGQASYCAQAYLPAELLDEGKDKPVVLLKKGLQSSGHNAGLSGSDHGKNLIDLKADKMFWSFLVVLLRSQVPPGHLRYQFRVVVFPDFGEEETYSMITRAIFDKEERSVGILLYVVIRQALPHDKCDCAVIHHTGR